MRLKAHWTVPGGYAVEYDLGGGRAGSSYPASIARKGWLYLKTPVKDGYVFAGWSLAGDISASGRYSTKSGVSQLLDPAAPSYGGGHDYCSFYGLTKAAGVVLLRANWAVPGGYAVEYDLSGGVATRNYPSMVEATKWMGVPMPTRDGYEFAGWTVEGAGANARYSVATNTSHPVVAGTPCGAGFSRCAFKELTHPGGLVRLTAHWRPL